MDDEKINSFIDRNTEPKPHHGDLPADKFS